RAAAFERVAAGACNQVDAAREIGLSQQRAHDLYHRWRVGGLDAITRKKRPNGTGTKPHEPTADERARHAMLTRLANPTTRARYAKRASTVECVFGTMHTRGHTQLHLRGHAGAITEWALRAIGHNLARFHRLALATP